MTGMRHLAPDLGNRHLHLLDQALWTQQPDAQRRRVPESHPPHPVTRAEPHRALGSAPQRSSIRRQCKARGWLALAARCTAAAPSSSTRLGSAPRRSSSSTVLQEDEHSRPQPSWPPGEQKVGKNPDPAALTELPPRVVLLATPGPGKRHQPCPIGVTAFRSSNSRGNRLRTRSPARLCFCLRPTPTRINRLHPEPRLGENSCPEQTRGTPGFGANIWDARRITANSRGPEDKERSLSLSFFFLKVYYLFT